MMVVWNDYSPPTPEEWARWSEAERSTFMMALETDRIDPMFCTCTTWCGEGTEAGCPSCVWRPLHDPCPMVGFGCGMKTYLVDPCECCTPEQWQAARSCQGEIREGWA